jgi:hypothetical protein
VLQTPYRLLPCNGVHGEAGDAQSVGKEAALLRVVVYD